MKKYIKNAKVAYLDINLQKTRVYLGVNIIADDPDKLEAIHKRKIDFTTECISKILDIGTNAIFTTKGIDDLWLKLLVEVGAMAVRRCKKEDLQRIAKPTGATLVSSLANLDSKEAFEFSSLGQAEKVVQERISDDECILIKGTNIQNAASNILRGAVDFMLDQMERSLHGVLCVVKRTLQSNSVVSGVGAVESALSIYLQNFASSVASREQLAIADYANTLLVISKTLTVNATKGCN